MMNELIQKGMEAYKAGKRDEARKIFISIVKQNPDNELAWQHLYEVSNNKRERIQCLKRIIRINPGNEKAHQLLRGRNADSRRYGSIIVYGLIGFALISSILTSGLRMILDWPVSARSITKLGNTTLLWEKDLEIEAPSTVYVEFFLPDERSVVFENSGRLYSMDILTGETVWETAISDIRTIRLLDNKFFITTADLDNSLDKAPSFDTKSSECSAYYGVTGLLTYNAITGEKIWGYRYDGASSQDMFFDDKNVYLMGSNDHAASRSIIQIAKNTGSVMSAHCNRWPNKNAIPTPPTRVGGIASTYSPLLEMRDMQRLDLDYYFIVQDSNLILLDRITKGPIAFIEFSGKKLDPWEIGIVNQKNIVMIYFQDSKQLFGIRLFP